MPFALFLLAVWTSVHNPMYICLQNYYVAQYKKTSMQYYWISRDQRCSICNEFV